MKEEETYGGTLDDEENLWFTPDQLLFWVYANPSYKTNDFPGYDWSSESEFCFVVCPKEYFDKEGHCYDDQMFCKALDQVGLNDQHQECDFGMPPEILTKQQAEAELLKLGLIQDPKFDAFMKQCTGL